MDSICKSHAENVVLESLGVALPTSALGAFLHKESGISVPSWFSLLRPHEEALRQVTFQQHCPFHGFPQVSPMAFSSASFFL